MNGEHLVRPGDLITAEAWNGLVDYLNGLEQRVEQLENNDTSQSLIITDLQYFSPLHIDDDLTIVGRNFGVAQVWLNDTPVTTFRQRSDGRIILVVPALPSWTTAAVATLRVLNPITGKSATREVMVHPRRVIITGDVQIDWLRAEPLTAGSGIDMRFYFSVKGEHSAQARFVVRPELQLIDPVPIDVLDSEGRVITDKQMDVSPGETKDFSLRMKLPDLPNGTPFRLGASFMIGDQPFGTSSFTRFAVGDAVPGADPTIDVEYASFDRNPVEDEASFVDEGGASVFVRPGTQIIMRFNLRFLGTNAGMATISVSPGTNTTGWTVGVTGDTDERINGTTEPISVPGIFVTPSESATQGELVFQVRRDADPTRTQTRRFRLSRV